MQKLLELFILAIVVLPFSYTYLIGNYTDNDGIRFIGSVNFSPRIFNSVYSLKTQELKSPLKIENTEGFSIQANAGILVPFGQLFTEKAETLVPLGSPAIAVSPNFSYSNFGDKIALNSITSFGLNIGEVRTFADTAKNYALTFHSGASPKWFLLSAAADTTLPHHQYIEYLSDGIRFGSSHYQSVGIDFFNTLTVSAKLERTFISPRYQFGKELGNGIVSTALLEIPSYGINRMTAELSPVGAFVISTLYRYVLTEIIKKNKSWPFNTPSPVTMDEISLGVTFKL